MALPEKKGGARTAGPANRQALEIIASLKPVDGSHWVFPRPANPARHVSPEVVENGWQQVRAFAGINDVHLHDLRHTLATVAASRGGVEAFVLRDMMRHSNVTMTASYAGKDQAGVRAGLNSAGGHLAADMAGKPRDPARPAKGRME